jgi:hypothetical protein
MHYTGCHKYVPFARFSNRRTCRVQRIEIITNMTTAINQDSLYLRGSDPLESISKKQIGIRGVNLKIEQPLKKIRT